eukprot:gene851-biopygen21203
MQYFPTVAPEVLQRTPMGSSGGPLEHQRAPGRPRSEAGSALAGPRRAPGGPPTGPRRGNCGAPAGSGGSPADPRRPPTGPRRGPANPPRGMPAPPVRVGETFVPLPCRWARVDQLSRLEGDCQTPVVRLAVGTPVAVDAGVEAGVGRLWPQKLQRHGEHATAPLGPRPRSSAQRPALCIRAKVHALRRISDNFPV